MLDDRGRAVLAGMVAADGAAFAELVALAGLDPATAFRGADLAGVDFGDADLDGYDFRDADLTGALLHRARTEGARFDEAILDGVRWPLPVRKERDVPTDGRLGPVQRRAVDRVLADLDGRGRAVALMPTGTGRSAVLEETIVATMARRGGRVLLLVNTAAEREQFVRRLTGRLGSWAVAELPRPGGTPRSWRHADVLVANATYRDFAYGDGEDARPSAMMEALPEVRWLFTTSVERVEQVLRRTEARPGPGLIAAVDNLPVEAGRPERRRLLARTRRLFGEPSFALEPEEAVDQGLLSRVPVVVPDVPTGSYASLSVPNHGETEAMHGILARMAEDVARLWRSIGRVGLLVLCRDRTQADLLTGHLVAMGVVHPSVVGPRPLPDDGGPRDGVVVAPLSNRSIVEARRHPAVAVATRLTQFRAQDLAYRPARLADASAVIFDLVDAFAGFPAREPPLPLGERRAR